MQQLVSIWVRDPRIQKNDFWHAYIDYEICLHVSRTNDTTCFSQPNPPCNGDLPFPDDQRVFYQEDVAREEEVQRVCVAQTEAPSKFHANVGQVNI